MNDLSDLLEHMIKDICCAEKQIAKELPRIARKADPAELRQAFEDHLEATRGQIANLKTATEHLGLAKRGERCAATQGIREEAGGFMGEIENAGAMDARMIASARAVEHHEITRYGTIVASAKHPGHDRLATLMQQNLDQEYAADRTLSKLAETSPDREAA
jgi:ferritin-like metal-binding protein YciE